MDRLRDRAFAGAVLSRDEDVGIGRSDAVNELQHRLHGRGARDQERPRLGLERSVLRLEPLLTSERSGELDLRPQDGDETRVLPRLLHEISRAAPHRLDRHLDAAPGGHHDDRQRRVVHAQLREQVEAFAAGGRVARVVEVHEHGVELAPLDGVERGCRRSG